MGLRPAKCYRKLERPYTRQSTRKPRRGYVKGVPEPRIHKFETGDSKKKFELQVHLVSNNSVQIRNNALEAARVSAHKILEKGLGPGNYFLKILIYPHHVLRENALATGAGADRFQTGMRKSFGKPISTAARVKSNQNVIEVRLNKNGRISAKKALTTAGHKLPTSTKIKYTDLQN